YSAAALLAFLALAGRGTEPLPLGNVSREQLDALRALGLALALLSLAGIPPTPGFWAKLAVLRVSWEALGLWPTLLAALGGVAGVLYYLRPLPDLLAATRSAGSPAPLVRPAVALGALVVLLLALVPGVAWSLAHLSG
ncbi:MAG TPA: proton-conducting transporter membrane subunit, partial [Chloroflexota bacterium]